MTSLNPEVSQWTIPRRSADMSPASRPRFDANLSSPLRVPEEASKRAEDNRRSSNSLRPGTVLGREWNGMHRVVVLAGGFAWNGTTYPSLSKIAFAITGTRWNGPRSLASVTRVGLLERGHDRQEDPSRAMRHLHPRIDRSWALDQEFNSLDAQYEASKAGLTMRLCNVRHRRECRIPHSRFSSETSKSRY